MQYAPKKILKKRKERKKPSWLREGVRAHLAFASKLLVAHGNPLSPQRRGKTLANLITSLVGFQIDWMMYLNSAYFLDEAKILGTVKFMNMKGKY